MKTKRDRLDIIRELLENVSRGYSSKSSLLKSMGISASSLNSYLAYAMEKNLIRESERGFELTEKGREVLSMLNEYTKLEGKLLLIMEALYRELEEL